jgi:SAM-dependent methyltransferase
VPGADTFHASAAAYDRLVGRYGPSLAAGLLAFAGVEPGMRALDVGCGPGALTAALTARLGGGAVHAVEPSEPFARACRDRVPGAEVVVAPAEDLPFAAATFDVALAQLVVNFLADPPAGVREMARVTRPGGVVAGCVWDYAGGMTVLRAFWDAARDVAPEAATTADEGVVMPWCAEGGLARLWRESGVTGVRSGALVARAAYAGFDDLWSPFPTGVAPSGAFCAALDEDRRAALREGLRRRLGVGDGPFELTARAWVVAGVVAPAPRRAAGRGS